MRTSAPFLSFLSGKGSRGTSLRVHWAYRAITQTSSLRECGRILRGRLGRSFFSATTMMAALSFRTLLQIVLVLSRRFGGSEFRATPMRVWFARRSVRRRRWQCSASRQQARRRSPLARKFLRRSRLLPMVFRNSIRVRSGQAGTDSRPVAELFAAYSSVLVLRSWPLLCSQ